MAGNIHNLDAEARDDDALLSRWLDGDLDTAARAGLEQRLARDPALAERLAEFERNDALVRQAFQSGAATRVPATVTATLAGDGEDGKVVPFASRRLPAYAMAASVLVVAGVLGLNSLPGDVSGPPAMNRALAAGLETHPSRADGWDSLGDGSELRAVLTFPAADGTWCREFLLAQNENHWRGVACRHEGSWVTEVIGREVFLEQETHYRPASASAQQKVAHFIDAAAVDVALGPDGEAELLANGWQSAP